MRKALLLLAAVAILGALGLYASGHNDNSSPIAAGSKSFQSSSSSKNYKDGTYTGNDAETPYGTVQIAVVVSGGKVTDVNFLKMPSADARSVEITGFSKPQLKQNTLAAQGANIDFVTGATSTSYGYKESLQAALDKAAGSVYLLNQPNPIS